MKYQATASRTSLLLACPRPFEEETELEDDLPKEAARYGSAFHKVVGACLRSLKNKPLEATDRFPKEITIAAKEFDVRSAAQELASHVKSNIKVLRNWLKREKLEILEVEEAYAVTPDPGGSWQARKTLPHDEDHVYQDVRPGEIPGTIDLKAGGENGRVVIIDHKTGSYDSDSFAVPQSLPQMRTLGLTTYAPKAEVGIFHADRKGLPIVYSEPYESSEQKIHSRELFAAMMLVGRGFLRPGPQCKYCPAKLGCPAHTAELISDSTTALVSHANRLAVEPIDPKGLLAPIDNGTDIETRAGTLYDLLKIFRRYEKAGTEEIRRLVKSGAVIETRDGKVLTLKEETYESLSKQSILDALGKIEGEKEIARLRKKGAIREATRERLMAEK